MAGRNNTAVKSNIRGMVPPQLHHEFIEVARFKAFIQGDSEKGAISDALTEAMAIWLKLNGKYGEALENYLAYERGEIELEDVVQL